MVANKISPNRCASQLTHILNAALGAEHFPVDVKLVAKEISLQKFPEDPISLIKGEPLPKFDGGLFRAPSGKKGWGIIYNNSINSVGRINYTLAHEFGHYLLHRLMYPDGFQCGQQDFVRWDSEYGRIEHQANVFAANLLMPGDDYRRQINAKTKANFDMIARCADRYQVSLIAAALRWIEYTKRRSVLVVSRDGFILWARSSRSALKSGAYFRTANCAPIAIPPNSLAASQSNSTLSRLSINLPRNTWFNEPCEEQVVRSEQYDFTISLLHLESGVTSFYGNDDNEDELLVEL